MTDTGRTPAADPTGSGATRASDPGGAARPAPRRRRWVSPRLRLALAALAALAVGVSVTSFASSARSDRTTPAAQSAPLVGSGPCGTAFGPPATYDHVVWIVMENKSFSQVIGSASAPYINSLANACGLATNFYAEAHPSLPNYIAMTSGGTQGITDDKGPSAHPLNVPSIFSQLGTDWRALGDSMPSNCYLKNSGLYAPRHNPVTYYTNIRTQCQNQNVPLTDTPNLSAKFTYIAPNLCDDMHKCPTASDLPSEVRNGDRWLSQEMPKIIGSPQYQLGRTAVFITWDEGTSRTQQIATLVISPYTAAGTKSSVSFDHYSMLKTTEQMLGINQFLGHAGDAGTESMRPAFGL